MRGGGLGIGLALSRRIAELHGGTIEAHSAGLGQGSEFRLTLPALNHFPLPGSETHKSRCKETAPVPPKRVLVVDDNQDAANTLNSLLESLGHVTRVAFDGPSALQISDEFHPEVVLLDIGMPGMNGYDVARRLRHRTGSPLKIVAITGWGTQEDRALSREAGFDRHLVKPVDEMELQRVLTSSSMTTH